jgi:hypothetical protein
MLICTLREHRNYSTSTKWLGHCNGRCVSAVREIGEYFERAYGAIPYSKLATTDWAVEFCSRNRLGACHVTPSPGSL